MELSTSIPIDKIRALIVVEFNERPKIFISINVITKVVGIETTIAKVFLKLFKNKRLKL